MPDLLTPAQRTERAAPAVEPAIAVRYLGSRIWVTREARLVAGAWIRNVGSQVARRIAIPDLRIEDGVWCRFRGIEDLEPGEEASLDPVFRLAGDKGHLEAATLTGMISKVVVGQVPTGQLRQTRWPLTVVYEDADDRHYACHCDIGLASLPLTLRIVGSRRSSRDG